MSCLASKTSPLPDLVRKWREDAQRTVQIESTDAGFAIAWSYKMCADELECTLQSADIEDRDEDLAVIEKLSTALAEIAVAIGAHLPDGQVVDYRELPAMVAEALRQSQSLPAGAVAGLAGKWRDYANEASTDPCECVSDEVIAMVRDCASELEKSLQADAREKGEAVEHLMAAIRSVALSGDYGISDEAIGVLTDAMDDVDSGAVGATQPAQASEKDNG